MKKIILLVLLLLTTTALHGQPCADQDYLRFKAQYPRLTIPLYNRVVRECQEHDVYNKIVRVNKPYDIAVRTVLALIQAESDFDPKARGKAGEWSYMQLMKKNLPKHYVKPLDTIHYGVAFLAETFIKRNGSTVRAINTYNRWNRKDYDINYIGKILDNIEK
jgi:soluble lytic murein transglycosylase-like protein